MVFSDLPPETYLVDMRDYGSPKNWESVSGANCRTYAESRAGGLGLPRPRRHGRRSVSEIARPYRGFPLAKSAQMV